MNPPCPMTVEPLRVLAARRETPDVMTVTVDAAGRGGLPFAPGQFNMVYAFGIGEVALSLSGDPARPGVAVHTIKAVGAVTEALCRLRRHTMLGLRGPYGHPWPLDEVQGADIVLVAGGLGMAPLRPVAYRILAERRRYGRVALLVGARTPADLLFRHELFRWQARGDLQVAITVDRAGTEWNSRIGVVPALIAELELDWSNTVAFVCGPEVMMRFAVRELGRRGLRDERIYLSMERNMKCAVGFCGHCQLGPSFICKDGPVLRYDRLGCWFWGREL